VERLGADPDVPVAGCPCVDESAHTCSKGHLAPAPADGDADSGWRVELPTQGGEYAHARTHAHARVNSYAAGVSYDVYLLPRELAGDDPEAAYERLEDEDGDESAAQPTPERERELREIAAELQAANADYELSGPYPAIGYWTLQLVDERPGTVLVDLYATYATAQLSYGAEDAATAVARLIDVVRMFERRGYVAYDPQLERVLRPDRDAGEVERIIVDIRGKVLSQLTQADAPPPRRGFLRRFLGG
jgi:hypothetical protein